MKIDLKRIPGGGLLDALIMAVTLFTTVTVLFGGAVAFAVGTVLWTVATPFLWIAGKVTGRKLLEVKYVNTPTEFAFRVGRPQKQASAVEVLTDIHEERKAARNRK